MKCPNCGKEIANDSNFCEYCGAKIEVQKTRRIKTAPAEKEYKRPNRFDAPDPEPEPEPQMPVMRKNTMQTGTKQKVMLAICGAVVIISLLQLLLNNYDEFVEWLFYGAIIGAVMTALGVLIKMKLELRPFSMAESNKEKPEFLGTFMGIGQMLLGAFKFRKVDDTFVTYTFASFLFPLFPTGCYRVSLKNADNYGVARKQKWNVFGSEKSNGLEILSIYLIFWGGLIMTIGFMMGIVF